MFHRGGARMSGGNLPQDFVEKINTLLDEFMATVQEDVAKRNLRRAVVRSLLSCNVVAIADLKTLWIAAQKESGMPSTQMLDHRNKEFSVNDVVTAAKWDFGFDSPFVISFPIDLIEQSSDLRKSSLSAIASSHIDSEIQRVTNEMNLIQVNPIFGPAKYVLDPRLVFVLMPFTESMTTIYTSIIKPVVESSNFNFVCKRADEIKSNKSIMEDIWKSICEAQLVVADLTGLNANVMYELGIAHTLGKETILLYQKNSEIKFPFDLSHIRRIEYTDSIEGSKKLEQELKETIQLILTPAALA